MAFSLESLWETAPRFPEVLYLGAGTLKISFSIFYGLSTLSLLEGYII
jgi:hypothetical protein